MLTLISSNMINGSRGHALRSHTTIKIT